MSRKINLDSKYPSENFTYRDMIVLTMRSRGLNWKSLYEGLKIDDPKILIDYRSRDILGIVNGHLTEIDFYLFRCIASFLTRYEMSYAEGNAMNKGMIKLDNLFDQGFGSYRDILKKLFEHASITKVGFDERLRDTYPNEGFSERFLRQILSGSRQKTKMCSRAHLATAYFEFRKAIAESQRNIDSTLSL